MMKDLIGSILTFAGTYIAGSLGRAVGEPLAYNIKFAYNVGGFRDRELMAMQADEKYLQDQSKDEEIRRLNKQIADSKKKTKKK